MRLHCPKANSAQHSCSALTCHRVSCLVGTSLLTLTCPLCLYQDAAALLKRQLQRLLPNVQIFLDVDIKDTNLTLEDHVSSSRAFLILLGSPKYFESPNCLREAKLAAQMQLPLILVHDCEASKNGASLEELRAACPVSGLAWRAVNVGELTSKREFCHRGLSEALQLQQEFTQADWDALGAEALRAGHYVRSGEAYFEPVVERCPLYKYIFGDDGEEPTETIPWHRVTELQIQSLARAAEKLLDANSSSTATERMGADDQHLLRRPTIRWATKASLYVPDAIAWKTPHFGRHTELYVSPHNEEACEVADEVLGMVHKLHNDPHAPIPLELVRERKHGGSIRSSARARSWLLFLHNEVFAGDEGRKLELEVSEALKRRYPQIVTVYDPAAGEFDQILAACPPSLRSAGLFNILAIEWHRGFHFEVSLRLVSSALGATLVDWRPPSLTDRVSARRRGQGRATAGALLRQMSQRRLRPSDDGGETAKQRVRLNIQPLLPDCSARIRDLVSCKSGKTASWRSAKSTLSIESVRSVAPSTKERAPPLPEVELGKSPAEVRSAQTSQAVAAVQSIHVSADL